MEKYTISHFGGARLADELVIYEGTGKTETNSYGLEAVVEVDRVVRVGSNDNVIPENGFVVSGHGKGAKIVETILAGAKVLIDREKMLLYVDVDDTAKVLSEKTKLDTLRYRFEALIESGEKFDADTAFDTIHAASEAVDRLDFKTADELLEEGYYLTASCKTDEIRAIWHRPYEKTASAVEETVKRLKDAGFGMILIETNYEGYANARKCVHDWLPIRKDLEGTDFDPIEEFIKAGKKYGVKIHAWLEDFFFGVEQDGCPMLDIHPEYMARTKDGGLLMDGWDCFYFLNPALDEVHDLLVDLYRELLDKYDFDGIQLDYIRYPVIKDIYHSAGFEDSTKAMFKADTGIDVDSIKSDSDEEWRKFNTWRAERITKYVSRIVDLVKEYRANGRDIKLSTAVFGDPDEAIRLKCQNWLYWVKQNWIDYIFPMAYFNNADDVGREIKYMVDNYGEAPNISGIAPMYNKLPIIEATKQVEACRKAGASGIAFFETLALTDKQIEKLKKGVFRY